MDRTQESHRSSPYGEKVPTSCSNCYELFDLTCKKCLRQCHKDKKDYQCKMDGQRVTQEQLKTLQKNLDVIQRLRERAKGGPQVTQPQINSYPVKARQETRKDNLLSYSGPAEKYMHRSESNASGQNQSKADQNNESQQLIAQKQLLNQNPITAGTGGQFKNQNELHSPSVTQVNRNLQQQIAPALIQGINLHQHKIEEVPAEEESYSNIHRGQENLNKTPIINNSGEQQSSNQNNQPINPVHAIHNKLQSHNQPHEEEKLSEKIDQHPHTYDEVVPSENSPQFGQNRQQYLNANQQHADFPVETPNMQDRKQTFGERSPNQPMSLNERQHDVEIQKQPSTNQEQSPEHNFKSQDDNQTQMKLSDMFLYNQNSIGQPTEYQNNIDLQNMASMELNSPDPKMMFDIDIQRGVTENHFMLQNMIQKEYMHMNIEKQTSEKIHLTIEHLPSTRNGQEEVDHLQDKINSINAAEEERKRREKMNEEDIDVEQERQAKALLIAKARSPSPQPDKQIGDNSGQSHLKHQPHSDLASPNHLPYEQHQRNTSEPPFNQDNNQQRTPSYLESGTQLQDAPGNIIEGLSNTLGVASQLPSKLHSRNPSQQPLQQHQSLPQQTHSRSPSKLQEEPIVNQTVNNSGHRSRNPSRTDRYSLQQLPEEVLQQEPQIEAEETNIQEASAYRKSDTTKSGKKKKKKSKKKKKKKGANNITVMESYYEDSILMDDIESRSFKNAKSRRSGKSINQEQDTNNNVFETQNLQSIQIDPSGAQQPTETQYYDEEQAPLEEQQETLLGQQSQRDLKKILSAGIIETASKMHSHKISGMSQVATRNIDEEQKLLIRSRLSEGLSQALLKSEISSFPVAQIENLQKEQQKELHKQSIKESSRKPTPFDEKYEEVKVNEYIEDNYYEQQINDNRAMNQELEMALINENQEMLVERSDLQVPDNQMKQLELKLSNKNQPTEAPLRNQSNNSLTLNNHNTEERQRKFRQQKLASHDVNGGSNSENMAQIPSVQFNSRNETDSAQSIVERPNMNGRRIQDGIPYFNQSVGRQNFHAFASQQQTKLAQQKQAQKYLTNSQTSLPEIQLQSSPMNPNLSSTMTPLNQRSQQLNSFNPSKPQLYKPNLKSHQVTTQMHEEFKEANQNEMQLMTMKSEGNLGIKKTLNNYLKSDHSYQAEEYNANDINNLQDDQQLSDNQDPNSQYDHDNYEGSLPPSRGSSTRATRVIQVRRQGEMHSPGVESSNSPQQMKIVRPLVETCKMHPKETVKYFCRDANCMRGLCPDCIIEHSKHDFIAANELAALEIKQVLKQAQRKCKNQVRIQKEVKIVTEKKLSDLNRQRNEEFQRLHCYFIELHKDLDEREAQLNQLFNEDIKETESALMQDLHTIRSQYSDNIRLFKELKNLYDHFAVSSEIAIVGNSDLAYQLSHKATIQSQQQASKKFFIQNDEGKQDIMTPIFHIHLSKYHTGQLLVDNEKDKIMRIGRVIPPQSVEEIEAPDNFSPTAANNTRINLINKGIDSALSMIPEESKSIHDSRNQIYSIRQSGENYSKSQSRKKRDSVTYANPNLRDSSTQTGEANGVEQNKHSIISNQALKKQDSLTVNQKDQDITHLGLKNIHWFRWDSNEVYRLNDQTRDWNLRSELKNVSKFLFFSSVVHLPTEQGCFILGGSDNDDNYSKRVQYFCKYNVFIEKPPMINKRAFFPSVFSKLDNSIYALGGSDSNSNDLNKCEKFSLVENVWRPMANMNLSRNGTAAVMLDQYRLIFVIGGNNHKHGSLTKIEKYEIDFDKWSIIDLALKTAIHDLSAVCVGKERVLIFGGHTNTEPNKEIQLVDLSLECYKSKIGKSKLMLQEGGKTYFPPSYDTTTNKIQILFGYCDEKPRIEEFDISEFVLQGNSNIGNKMPSELGSRRNSFQKNLHINSIIERRSHSQQKSPAPGNQMAEL